MALFSSEEPDSQDHASGAEPRENMSHPQNKTLMPADVGHGGRIVFHAYRLDYSSAFLFPGTTFSTILPADKYQQAENNDAAAKDELCECPEKHPFFS